LLGAQDFEGAENLLLFSLGATPKNDAYLHLQLGKMYVVWNKLTSSLNHLTKAAELAQSAENEMLVLQVLEELKAARARQQEQAP
jgi:hypothetical protein